MLLIMYWTTAATDQPSIMAISVLSYVNIPLQAINCV